MLVNKPVAIGTVYVNAKIVCFHTTKVSKLAIAKTSI